MLCTVVKEERDDTDMLRAALECLIIAIGNPTKHSESSGKVGCNVEQSDTDYTKWGGFATHALMACRDSSLQH